MGCSSRDNRIFTPELLAPAGSPEALAAAIEAGADAVYMGGEHNARAFARNFDRDAIREAIALCRAYGTKAYVTLNTLVYEREMAGWLEYARYLWECGADAFIVADLGAAALLRRYIPDVRLHASTQMSVHNSQGVRELSSLGFERVVVARELSRENIRAVVEKTDTEIEMFVHGALCVSASGQCLFSSLVGGRSGNRGECAQPCRLEYNGRAMLSLRDNCLASHIEEICNIGVHSLKIEGRMKTPEYVYGTVSTYRRLLDERRNATDRELCEMAGLFSRSGFTDGYYTGRLDGMCGVRRDIDKKQSAEVQKFAGLSRKIPVQMECTIIKDTEMTLRLSDAQRSVSVSAGIPAVAENAPIDRDSVLRSLTKFGSTPYTVSGADITLGEGLFVRAAELNALRRSAVEALGRCSREAVVACSIDDLLKKQTSEDSEPYPCSARFISAAQLRESCVSIRDIPRIFLPLSEYTEGSAANGIILPPLVYDTEWERMTDRLLKARECGAEYALCPNISTIIAAKKAGYTVTADFRLNCTNPYTADELIRLGADEIILSPELKSGGMRDIHRPKSVIVYGRIPLMLCHRCAVRDEGGCKQCKNKKAVYIKDRTGARFPVFSVEGHHSEIYNSAPTYTADVMAGLRTIGRYAMHFIFSDESAETVRRVLRAYREGTGAAEVFGCGVHFRRL